MFEYFKLGGLSLLKEQIQGKNDNMLIICHIYSKRIVIQSYELNQCELHNHVCFNVSSD